MTASNYAACLKEVLKHEGGYANHPRDPGGATMRGVTQRVYDSYRARKNLGQQHVRLINDFELREIYRKQYWDVVRGDDLPAGVDLAVFDYAVNSGPVRAGKALQIVLGFSGVDVDGHIGERTLQRVKAGYSKDAVEKLCDRRMRFLRALPTWPDFGAGWASRVASVRKVGKAMAAHSMPREQESEKQVVETTPAEPQTPESPKAKPGVQETSPSLDKTITVATGAAGAGAAILGAIQSPWGVAALVVLLAFAGAMAWRFWPREKMPEMSA